MHALRVCLCACVYVLCKYLCVNVSINIAKSISRAMLIAINHKTATLNKELMKPMKKQNVSIYTRNINIYINICIIIYINVGKNI